MSLNRFGRLVAPPDARDHQFLMRAAMPQINVAVGKPKPRTRPYRDGPLLDQGNTPRCVGYSARGFLDGAPIMLKPNVGPSATAIYDGAQANDEWAGNDYDGSSVRGAMKFLASVGQISSYAWATSVDEIIAWIMGGYGTALMGSNWYQPMSEVDKDGFMREPAPSMSTPIGGHAWRIVFADAKKKAVLMRNSWGPWGIEKKGVGTGYAWIRKDFLERLFREDGECAAPVQLKLKASTI